MIRLKDIMNERRLDISDINTKSATFNMVAKSILNDLTALVDEAKQLSDFGTQRPKIESMASDLGDVLSRLQKVKKKYL